MIVACTTAAPVAAGGSFGERLRGLFGDDDSASSATILPVDEAFRFSASTAGPDSLSLFWQIADGYYLYRDRFAFSIRRGNASIQSDAVIIPDGIVKEDVNFGDVEVNTGEVAVEIPLQRPDKTHEAPIVLQVAYQGCKEDSVCYPPVKRDIAITLSAVPGD